MNNQNLIILALIFFNGVTLFVISAIFKKLPNSRARTALLILIFSYIGWVNPLYAIQISGISEELATVLSKMVFVFGLGLTAFFKHFVIQLSNEKYGLFAKILQFNMGVNLVLLLLNYMEDGVYLSKGNYLPNILPLYQYQVYSLLLSQVYTFGKLIVLCRNAKSEIIKYQSQSILVASFVAFLGLILTNSILPSFGISELVFFGGCWFLFLFSGITYVLIQGKSIHVKKAVNQLLNEPEMEHDKNIFSLREMVRWVKMIVKNNPDQSSRKLTFVNGSPEGFEISLNKGVDENALQLKGQKSVVPIKWFDGLFESVKRLQEDNIHMAFALMRADNQLQEKWLEKEMKSISTMSMANFQLPSYQVKKFRDVLQKQIAMNEETYGCKLLCFSKQMFDILLEIQKYSKTDHKIVFQGEHGVGKTTMAKCMHHYRNGYDLLTHSCMNRNTEGLSEKISMFVSNYNAGDYDGLLIKHVDELAVEDYHLLEPLFEHGFCGKYVYFTSCATLSEFQTESIHPILHRLANQIKIMIPPLNERPDDAFYQTLWYIDQTSKDMDEDMMEVKQSFLDQVKDYSWPGNSAELQDVVQRSILESQGPVLEQMNPWSLNVGESKYIALEDSSQSHLSQLEIAEKKVICDILQKNQYNKTRTKDELKITINTLNTKIKKYEIELPNKP